MAVTSTFKQQCPTCDAMVSVKESMIGKRVECTKCKDKFIAEKPDEDEVEVDLEVEEDDEKPMKKDKAKKNSAAKSAVTSKAPSGKRPKLEVEVEVDDEEGDEDEGETGVQVKPGKNKAITNGKPKKGEDDEDEVDDEDDADESPKKKKDKTGSNKLMIGLGLAAVGVLVLVVAGYFIIFRKPPTPPAPFNPNGGDETKVDENPGKGPPKFDVKPPPAVAVALTDAELAKLSNLLPGDTEHVFRVAFRDLFTANGPLANAIFGNPDEPDPRKRQGALDDADLRNKLGFSITAIDDMIVAEKNTSPNWKFTVIHFKDIVSESEIKSALKLESAGTLEGQPYFKLAKANAAFDQLARFSIGIPNFYRFFEGHRNERASFVRFHNPQTVIVGDQTPMLAFLKVKGQFPLQTTRQPAVDPKTLPPGPKDVPPGTPMPPGEGPTVPGKGAVLPPGDRQTYFTVFQQPDIVEQAKVLQKKMAGTFWDGVEDSKYKIRMAFLPNGGVAITSEKFKFINRQFPAAAVDGTTMQIFILGTEYRVALDAQEVVLSGSSKFGTTTGTVFLNKQAVVGPAPGTGMLNLAGTKWAGGESAANTKLGFDFTDGTNVLIECARVNLTDAKGTWKSTGPNTANVESPDLPNTVYEVKVEPSGRVMIGDGKSMNVWQIKLDLVAGTPPKIGGGPSDPKDPPKKDPDMPPDPKDPPKDQPNPNAGREDFYLTIKPSLKAILDKMETRISDKDRILFSSATDMAANTLDQKDTGIKDAVVRLPRQFWDVTLLLTERKPRIRFLGTALAQRGGETLKYQLRNELTCAQEFDAREFQQEMIDRTAYQVSKFIFQVAKHDVKLPSEAGKNPPVGVEPVPQPMEGNPDPKSDGKKLEPLVSQISVKQDGSKVEFVLDLLLDNSTFTQTLGISSLTASSLRVEMEAAASPSLRHTLANAAKLTGEKGLPSRQVPPGQFPPGAFVRTKVPLYADKEPKNRISWMAALLPYMGHKNLHDRIRFDQSWRDSSNWMAGHTVVPQFLDPTYPDFTRQTAIGDLSVDFAATHYVGVAGVGLDAASYKRGDPATAHKRGVFAYDGSASLQEVIDGRGTANTILMIQIPYDSGTGVSPWIAGGGATLRGVPEKNSIAPFVLGKDRNDKTIQYPPTKGAKGTYAVMTDGSVRFIGENVSDDVFKAMCTVGGPAPADFDLKRNPSTPLVPPPAGIGPAVKKAAPAPQEKAEPEKKSVLKEQEKSTVGSPPSR